MKKTTGSRRQIYSLLTTCSLMAASLTMGVAATFTNSPSATSNTYAGFLTLQIGGLTNGETVLVERYVDANANGAIDGADFLMESFRLTDGQASVIGGATNINVPFDADSVTGAITCPLSFAAFNINLVGQYLYRLSSPSARFGALTNTFTITNSALGQWFTGTVKSSGTNVPYAGVVVMAAPHGIGVAGAIANGSGAFTVSVAPGAYQLMAFKSNFVAAMSAAPTLTLSNGVPVTTNVSLLPATQIISGKIYDAANTNNTLPGALVFAQSTNGQAAVGFSDANGNYTVRATAAAWQLDVNDSSIALQGYVGSQNQVVADVTTGDAIGVDIALTKATALFFGTLKDELGNPVPGVSFSSDDMMGSYQSYGWCDANGNYAVPATATNWWVGISSDDAITTNYVFTSGSNAMFASNQAVRVDFFAKHATHHITGLIKDTGDNPIPNVGVYAYAELGGTYYEARWNATGDGTYILPAVNGYWTVRVGCEGNDGLLNAGYCCTGDQNIFINNADGIANFTAPQAGEILISTTSPLPPAAQGSGYWFQFDASSCLPPFHWLLSPGSPALPAGLNLSTNGILSGTPAAAGSNSFSVRVIDNGQHTNDKPFLLVVTPPALQVTTASPLPDGQQGVFYSEQLQASGGVPPYSWTNLSSLPAGLNLSSGGLLSGTPTTSGTFNISGNVADSGNQSTNKNLALTVLAPVGPDVVSYYITKLKLFQQLDATTLMLNSNGGPFQARVGLIQSATGSVAIANVTLPTGAVRGLPLGGTGIELASVEGFTEEAAFEAAYPLGNYTFALYGINDGLRFPVLPLPAAAYPVAPRISNFAACQAINPANPFTLQWDALAGASGYDPLWLVIAEPNGTLVFSTPYPPQDLAGALRATTNSVSIPTNTLQLNHTYVGTLTFFQASSINTTAYPGAMGYTVAAAQTRFPLTTRSPVPTLSNPERINPNVFRFTVNGLAGQNYTIQASSNLVNWNSIRTTNAPADVFILQLNLATNSRSAYRLKVEP